LAPSQPGHHPVRLESAHTVRPEPVEGFVLSLSKGSPFSRTALQQSYRLSPTTKQERQGCWPHHYRGTLKPSLQKVFMSLSLIVLIVLILMLVGALPTWGHSRSWGYGPSGGVGLIVIILLILLLTGRI
jgi:hypothetical protein